MKICSVTLVKDDHRTARAAQETVKDLVDFTYTQLAGTIENFAEARNDLLAWAHRHDYDWAIMLDTDERIVTNLYRSNIEKQLDETDADVIMIPHVSDTYEKERFFRMPAAGHYHGRTHEAWLTDPGAKRVTWGRHHGLLFDEVPKTPDQTEVKLERDLLLLADQVSEDPDDPRWHYYLGDTYTNLGEFDMAIAAFSECFQLDGWDEESAWAAYRIAELWAMREGYSMALHWATMGMQRHPGISELHWLAGWCCYQLGRYEHARAWANTAITLNAGYHGGWIRRVGFKHPPALYEGPWDLERWIARQMGMPENYIARLDQTFERRLAERTQKKGEGASAPSP